MSDFELFMKKNIVLIILNPIGGMMWLKNCLFSKPCLMYDRHTKFCTGRLKQGTFPVRLEFNLMSKRKTQQMQ